MHLANVLQGINFYTYMCVLRKASTARFLKIVFTFFQSLNIPTKEKYFKKKLITQDEIELNF